MGNNKSWIGPQLNLSHSYDSVSVVPPGVPSLGDNDSLVMNVIPSSVTYLQGDLDPYKEILNGFKEGLLRLDEPWVASLLGLYTVLFVFSLTGNIVALLVILSKNTKILSTSTNTFLLNMTIADILGKLISPLFT